MYYFNKMFYYVLAQHHYIIINTSVLATCFGFYQSSSGLSLLMDVPSVCTLSVRPCCAKT